MILSKSVRYLRWPNVWPRSTRSNSNSNSRGSESGRVQLITIRLIYSSFAIRLVNENPTGIVRVDGTLRRNSILSIENDSFILYFLSSWKLIFRNSDLLLDIHFILSDVKFYTIIWKVRFLDSFFVYLRFISFGVWIWIFSISFYPCWKFYLKKNYAERKSFIFTSQRIVASSFQILQ